MGALALRVGVAPGSGAFGVALLPLDVLDPRRAAVRPLA